MRKNTRNLKMIPRRSLKKLKMNLTWMAAPMNMIILISAIMFMMGMMILPIQQFDPPGVCARNLQECLLIQLEKRVEEGDHVEMAIKVLEKYFDEFTKKHYEKIQRGLNITDEQLRQIINQIIKLNPKPG